MAQLSAVIGSIAALSAITLVSAPASAEQGRPSFSREVDDWQIFGGHADNGEGICIMRGHYQSGTTISVSMSGSRAEDFYFMFFNPAWRSVSPRQSVQLTIRFNERPAWTIDAVGLESNQEDGFGIGFQAPLQEQDGTSFVVDFMLSNWMRIDRDRVLVDGFNLSSTRAAIMALVECNQQVRNGADFDPFAGSGRPR